MFIENCREAGRGVVGSSRNKWCLEQGVPHMMMAKEITCFKKRLLFKQQTPPHTHTALFFDLRFQFISWTYHYPLKTS